MRDECYVLAEALAGQGYVALALDYYGGRWALHARLRERWETWQERVRNSVAFLEEMPEVQADRIGVVGFSQGGFLAISTASSLPPVKAVVSFYGGATSSLNDYIENLPPLLLLHGEADSVVSVDRSRELYEVLVKKGKPAELKVYPDVRHVFNFQGSNYDALATADAQKRMLAFLKKYLMPAES